jgi:hypothetical protein
MEKSDTANEDRAAASTRAESPASILLPAAMTYCGKRLLDVLERSNLDGAGDAGAQAVLAGLSASTRTLLSWWFVRAQCGRRPHNFHSGQREAILHTILACELFGSDDPQTLFEAACGVEPNPESSPSSTGDRRAYRLRMPNGSGASWVISALIVWQWAGRKAADERRDTSRETNSRFDRVFGTHLSLVAPTGNDALRDGAPLRSAPLCNQTLCEGMTESLCGDILLHIDLFVPPNLRRDFVAWLQACRNAPNDRLRIDASDDAERAGRIAAIRLIVALDENAPGSAAAPRSLSIEVENTYSETPSRATVLAELSIARALRIGAVKSVLLVDAGVNARLIGKIGEFRSKPRRRGRRPVLPRRLRPLLDIALRALDTFERETRALRKHLGIDAEAALLVLCERPELRHAVAAYARQSGVAREAIVVCDPRNGVAQRRARIVIDALPAEFALAQSRFCAVVLLGDVEPRIHDGVTPIDALDAVLGPALAPHWRAPSLIETKAENRERIAMGHTPRTLIDVLPVIASMWPPVARPASPALSRVAHDALPPPAGDLFVNDIRDDHREVDIVLPSPSDATFQQPMRWLSQQPPCLLRARDAYPVRKCVYRHLGWSSSGDGLERAFIEMAELDPNIRTFALFHPLRQPWPAIDDSDDGQDEPAFGSSIAPNAVALTSSYAYIVRFASSPLVSAQEHSSAIAPHHRDATIAWCRRINVLSADRRQAREWRATHIQAPLFWSWKRHGRSLSSLLSALADAAPILVEPSRTILAID